MDVRAYLLERGPLVERALEAALPPADALPASLHAALRHALFPGGKRLRPALALAAAEAVGAPPERALPVAVAVELVHAYSLVHDDLPCMDDDAERRGRPSVHAAFGEATAVLAGDALLALAFEVLCSGDDASAPQRLAAARDLAAAAGARALVGGQVDDLAFSSTGEDASASTGADAERVESVHRRKTAALIAAALVGGARLGGADAATRRRLARCGQAMGVAFQIADDWLDRDSDEACSLVRVAGPEASQARAQALFDQALAELEALGERAEPLRALARYAVWRTE